MASGGSDDLTDTWHGRYSYARGPDPVAFVAELRQSGDVIDGTVEEPGPDRGGPSSALVSEISGRTAGGAVAFVKTYRTGLPGYSAVRYEGRLGDGGMEIVGTWRIWGDWSGTFIMIRSRGLPTAVERRQEERAR